MREIQIEKVTINIGVGRPGEELEKAKILLEKLTGQKPIETKAKKRIPGWNIRPGLSIGAKVTIRGKKAEELLNRLLEAVGKKLKESQFDNTGNVSFGIKEYIDIPGMKYDHKIGILGMDVCVTLKRPGYRIKYRRIQRKAIPYRHRVKKEDAIEFMKNRFGVNIE